MHGEPYESIQDGSLIIVDMMITSHDVDVDHSVPGVRVNAVYVTITLKNVDDYDDPDARVFVHKDIPVELLIFCDTEAFYHFEAHFTEYLDTVEKELHKDALINYLSFLSALRENARTYLELLKRKNE